MQFTTIQGVKMDKLGFGTWNLRGNECYQATLSALEIGYRHIDTAEMYQNEDQVGRAIADSGLERSELFITTKVYSHLRYEDVLRACEGSLRKLGLEAIDLYLIHWPSGSIPMEDTMRGMNELLQQDLTRYVGVSNFSVKQFEEAQRHAGAPIFTNQIPHHPLRFDQRMLAYCQEKDVMLTAYSPLAKGRVARDSTLQMIAERHDKSAAQVALRWLMQQDKVVAIPKSSRRERQQENFAIFDFELSEEEVSEINRLG